MKNMLEVNIEKKNNGYIESKIYCFYGNYFFQIYVKWIIQYFRKIMVIYSYFIFIKLFLNKVYI